MQITDLPFSITGMRLRPPSYSRGYLADPWCTKGHILLCIVGELEIELADGRRFVLTPCASYQVADQVEPLRSTPRTGARLFVLD